MGRPNLSRETNLSVVKLHLTLPSEPYENRPIGFSPILLYFILNKSKVNFWSPFL